jgi:hypothetical protein
MWENGAGLFLYYTLQQVVNLIVFTSRHLLDSYRTAHGNCHDTPGLQRFLS